MIELTTIRFGGGTLSTNIPGFPMARHEIIETAAKAMGASPSDIPGLWNLPGHPELTSGQLVGLYMARVS